MELIKNSTGPVDITNTQSTIRIKVSAEMDSKSGDSGMTKLEQLLRSSKNPEHVDDAPSVDSIEQDVKKNIEHTTVHGGIQKRAILTLPEILLLRTSTKGDEEKSIYTVQPVAKGTKFGPYEGEVKDKGVVSRYCWEIFRDGKLLHYIDGCDDSKASWMKFVRFASSDEQSNLIAYQHKEEIFFETTQDVPANKELLLQVWGSEFVEVMETNGDMEDVAPHDRDGCSQQNLHSSTSSCTELLLDHNENEQRGAVRKARLRRLSCSICGKTFQDKHKLKRHQITHTNEKPYACGKCGKLFRRSDTVRTHIKNCHKESAKWLYVSTKVVASGTTTNSKNNKSILRKLFQRSNPGHQGTQKCPICEKEISACNFSRHIKVHTRPYKCELCNKRFSRPADGRRHLLKHHKIQGDSTLNYIKNCKNIAVSDDDDKREAELEDTADGVTTGNDSDTHSTSNGTGNEVECEVSGQNLDISLPHCKDISVELISSADGEDCSDEVNSLSSLSHDEITGSASDGVDSASTSSTPKNSLVTSPERYSTDSPTVINNSSKQTPIVNNTGEILLLSDDGADQHGAILPQASTLARSKACTDLSCLTCGKTFSSTSKLNRHMLTHSGLKPHICEICGRGFSRSEYIKDHKQRKHKHHCDDVQDQVLNDIPDLSSLFSAFIDDTGQETDESTMSVLPVAEVQQLESVYDGGIYVKEDESLSESEHCNAASDKLSTSQPEKCHTLVEANSSGIFLSSAGYISSPLCKEISSGTVNAVTDLGDGSAKKTEAIVSSCSRAGLCSSKGKLGRRMNIHRRPYNCRPCHRQFSQLNSYLSHKLTKSHQENVSQSRTDDKDGTAQEDKQDTTEVVVDQKENISFAGDKTFTDTKNHSSQIMLKENAKDSQGESVHVHVDGRPFECPQCGNTFSQIGNLKTHQYRVHARKRDRCPICGKYFSCVKNHMKVHTGEKPYHCPDCGKAFSQSGNLRVHQRKQHSGSI